MNDLNKETEAHEPPAMNARERLVARILFVLARMVAPAHIADELKHLANHINLYGGRP